MKFSQKNIFKHHARLSTMLTWLTLLCITAQIMLFIGHYKVNELLDSLVQSALLPAISYPVVLLPLLAFFLLQIIGYFLFTGWIWFISVSLGELLKLSSFLTYLLGNLFFIFGWLMILSLNNYYYPDSFFSQLWREATGLNNNVNLVIVFTSSIFFAITTLLAYVNFFWRKHYLFMGNLILFVGMFLSGTHFYNKIISTPHFSGGNSRPDIILIGLDSLRPDFVSAKRTPQIDTFLKSSATFTESYTPLARTFPAWISVLTARYPKHNHVRNNLVDPAQVLDNEMLAQRLKKINYETIYATDEKRFSNIIQSYGFDRILGPKMGINDFILGSLSDFPLTNLLINTSAGQWLFPYNFANRAAAITYQPNDFLQLVKQGLAHRQDKPLFLAIHLCVSHWPYTWARDQQADNLSLAAKYSSSVEAVDKQFGQLMQILKQNGLLKHSMVVLLSDHGTTLGLPGDRIIAKQNYQGDTKKLHWIPIFQLSSPEKGGQPYQFDTSYGQGTDVLSLKQYHVLLAFKGFGIPTFAHSISDRSSLLDIAPTLLDFLDIKAMHEIDGASLKSSLFANTNKQQRLRPLILESGYSPIEIESKDISVNHILSKEIGVYRIDPKNGLLFINPDAEQSMINKKQRAILLGDWLLARYPENSLTVLDRNPKHLDEMIFKSVAIPAYFILVNVKTGQWTIGLNSPLAKKAPRKELLNKFDEFYGKDYNYSQALSPRKIPVH